MEILNESLFEDAMPLVEKIIKQGVEILRKKGEEIIHEVTEEYLPLVEDFIKNMTGEIQGKAFGKEVDVLDMVTLVDFAKKYIVNGSNEIVAIRSKEADGYFIYLAYSQDRELIEIDKNRYLIIKAKQLADDVNQLFNESELIILK